MRYLAIFELILISLGLIGFSLYLLFADGSGDVSESSMAKSIKSGQLKNASLVVVDKYETGGRKNLQYVILASGKDQSDIIRLVPKGTYNNIDTGDQFFGYDFGSDYMIPAFDNPQTGDGWKLYAGIMSAFFSFAFIFAAYKMYKHGKLKDVMSFETRNKPSGFRGAI